MTGDARAALPSRRRLKFIAAGILLGTLIGSISIALLRHKGYSGVIGALAGAAVAVTVLYFCTRPLSADESQVQDK